MATAYDSAERVAAVYPRSRQNIAALGACGAAAVFDVDVTNLEASAPPWLVASRFDAIIFNFPLVS